MVLFFQLGDAATTLSGGQKASLFQRTDDRFLQVQEKAWVFLLR